jgi:hypothetical protein
MDLETLDPASTTRTSVRRPLTGRRKRVPNLIASALFQDAPKNNQEGRADDDKEVSQISEQQASPPI